MWSIFYDSHFDEAVELESALLLLQNHLEKMGRENNCFYND